MGKRLMQNGRRVTIKLPAAIMDKLPKPWSAWLRELVLKEVERMEREGANHVVRD